MISPTGQDTAATAARDQFIPVRKSDILEALVEHGQLTDEAEREQFRQLCRLLGAIYHYEYFDRLEQLRDAYFYFDPELDPGKRFDQPALDQAYTRLVDAFTAVLKGANFVEMPHDEIERAHRQHAHARLEVRAPVKDFRDIRFFHRGHHTETIEVRRWYGWRTQGRETLVFDDVVLFVAMKPATEIGSERERKRLTQRRTRPGSVLIKYFRNIASGDLQALFPNVRVVMSLRDKLFLSGPALVGGVPILLKLVSTITVLFLVLGFYLGLSGAVADDQMTTAFAAMSGLVALGGFLVRQWLRYQNQSLKYQKSLTDHFYFRNINNNAGIFDYIIGAAEEQECKEAFLAYYFLRTSPAPPTQIELDQRIEYWLKDTFGVDIDFEVEDALAKLDRLGLLSRDGERLSVMPPTQALSRLDSLWDDYFRFAPAPAG